MNILSNTIINQIDSSILTKHQKYLIKVVIISNILEFFDLFLIGFILAFLIKDIHWHLTSMQTSLILSGSGIGTVFGAIIWGRIADYWGRKKSLILCIIIVVISTVISAITPNNDWFFLFFMRICVGLGVGGLNITSIPYIQEFMPTRKRGLLTGLTSSFVPLGLLFGSLVTRYLSDFLGWRGLLLVGCIPVFLLPWIKKIPESPRFLLSKGLLEEAKKSYSWALNIPIKKLGILPKYNKNKYKVSYFNIIQNNLLSLVIVSIGTFCFIFGSFIIQSWGQILLSKSFNFSINKTANLFIILSLGDFFGRLLSSWISDFIGRRWTIFIFGIFGAFGCLVSAFFIDINKILIYFFNIHTTFFLGWIFFSGIFITMTFGDGIFGIINVFGGEMFSNSVRTTCLGLSYGIGSTAKIISPIFFGSLFIEKISLENEKIFFSFFMFSLIFLFGSIVYLFGKETKNILLEKI